MVIVGVLKIYFIPFAVWRVQGQELEARVVGGKDAPEDLVQHQVGLKRMDHWTFCGGAVISDRWILTAAHCVIKYTPSDIYAVVGTLSRTIGGDAYHINKIIPHERYNKPNKYNNDIGLISTTEAIQFNRNVQPLPLPQEDTPEGMLCVISGWGKLGKKKQVPDNIQYLYVTTMSSSRCYKYYKKYTSITISEYQICSLNKRGEGTCQGDSGGSLVCNGTSAGIVSFNYPCANGFPDAYANTYMYKSWIDDQVSLSI